MRIFGAYDAFPKNSKRLHFTQITVVIGEPLVFSPNDLASATRETYQTLSDRVMEAIAALRIE
jgi:1-acyl-sn-glycerol-3-phosphate acyltransferase